MLEDVIVAVNGDFAARGILNAQGTALVCAMGGDELTQHLDAPPRIIVTPTRDPFTGPRKLGGNPRQLFCRSAGADVEVWGVGNDGSAMGDYAATARLLHDFIVALRHVGFADFELLPAVWNRRKGNNLTIGRVVVLPILVHVPVVDTTLSVARITAGKTRTARVDPRPTRAPTISSIVPSSVDTVGGAITLHGSHFSTAPIVLLGGVVATNIVRVSDATITCNAPAHADGFVDVQVINSDGLTTTAPRGLRYHDAGAGAPAITSITPNVGAATGGKHVTIAGSHFTGATSVQVGGSEVSAFNVVDDATITAVTSAGAPGAALDVHVTAPTGTGSLVGGWDTYPAGPAIWCYSEEGLAGLSEGDPVPSWQGDALSLDPTSPTRRPTFHASDPQYDGRPVLLFDGVSQALKSVDFAHGLYTLILVGKDTTRSYLYSTGWGDYTYTNTTVSLYTVWRGNGSGTGASAWNVSADWGLSSTPRTYVRRMDGTHAGDILRINGVAQATVGGGSALDPGNFGAPACLYVGSYLDVVDFLSGSIALVAMYPRVLSDDEVTIVETIARNRYRHY